MKRTRTRRQRRYNGGRLPVFTGLDHLVESAIRRDMQRHGCSRSMLISCLLQEVYQIKGREKL